MMCISSSQLAPLAQRWLAPLALGLLLGGALWSVTLTALPLHAQTSSPATFTCSAVTEIPTSECTALVALYTSTNGPQWTNQNGWLTTTTPCSWYGVTCQANQVKRLDLANNQLTGVITPAIANLTALQKLWLSYNRLSGPIPPELGTLTNLQLLHLVGNQLTGSIPPQLGSLTQLYQLSLDANALSGLIPAELGNLARLRELRLTYNQLAGVIPAALGNLANLQGLMLAQNRLEGSIPAELGNLANLQLADFTGNQLRGAIPAQLVNWGTMDHLKFDYNALTATDSALLAWLAAEAPGWDATQTVPPTHVGMGDGRTTIYAGWTPIPYQNDGGYYEVSFAFSFVLGPSNDFTVMGRTSDKSATIFSIPYMGLPSRPFYARVRTYTPAHAQNQNALWSDYSAVGSSQYTFNCANVTEIPEDECAILVAFFHLNGGSDSRNGAWNNVSWLSNHTPCDWVGITCQNGHVVEISLPNTNLHPTHSDQEPIYLNPLGDMLTLQKLDLSRNRFNEPLLPVIGKLKDLTALNLQGSQLFGAIPIELAQLNRLTELDLSYNGLSTTDAALRTWLTTNDPDWELTQTVPPTNITLSPVVNGQMMVSWTPILYTADDGNYEIWYAVGADGPWNILGIPGKSSTNFTISGLLPDVPYYVRMRTHTYAPGFLAITSEFSPIVRTDSGATNLLVNGNFEAGTAPWLFTTTGVGALTTTGPAYAGNASAQIEITQKGTHTQLYQTGFPLEPKTRYRLTLAARSSRGQDLALYLQQAASPNANYGLRNFRLNLTRSWKQFTVEFVTKGFKQPTADTQLRLWLQPYVATGDLYWLDAISLTKVSTVAVAAQMEQGERRAITGTVQLPPPFTAPVPLTLVDLESEGARFTQTVTTAADGAFAFTDVPIGTYELRALAPVGALSPEPYQVMVGEAPNEALIFVIERSVSTLYLPLISQ